MSLICNTRVALVGRQLPDSENLGLGYLQVALDNLGVESKRFVLNDARAIGSVAKAIRRDGFHLVGISMPDGGSAVNFLALGQMLREVGYVGAIIAGGPFATLARAWLLERYAWLDAVVRFAGELPLVGIVKALNEGRDFTAVPGVSTRRGDGAPAPVSAEQPLQLTPTHSQMPRLLGHQVAHIQATRGCAGRCGYCGPAALQLQEYTEGLNGGVTPDELRRRGVGGVRRRPVEHLAREIKQLYATGARYIYLVDEHFLPYRNEAARAYLAQLVNELRRNRVGRIGLGCMLKAERLTTDLLDPLVKLGVIRAFVGLEFSSVEEGRRYHRRVDPQHGRNIVGELERRGVACVSNLMLVHPHSTSETILAGLDHLASIEAGIVETTRMMVYHGTQLLSDLVPTGRITGNPLRYGYRLDDPIAQRFSEAFSLLRLRVFGDHSLAQVAHAVALSLALARRLHAELDLLTIQTEYQSLEREIQHFTVHCLRRVFKVIEREASTSPMLAALFDELAQSETALRRRANRIEADLSRLLRIGHQRFAPTRAAAARSLTFTLMGATVAACSTHDDSHWATGGDSAPSTGGSSSMFESGGATPTSLRRDCSMDETAAFWTEVRSAVRKEDACFSGTLTVPTTPAAAVDSIPVSRGWTVHSAVGGGCFDYHVCSSLNQFNVAGIATALAPFTPPDCELHPSIAVSGDSQVELNALTAVIRQSACLSQYSGATFAIQVDAEGNFVDVTGSYLDTQTLDCMRTALTALSFPCLGSAQICPEVCVAE